MHIETALTMKDFDKVNRLNSKARSALQRLVIFSILFVLLTILTIMLDSTLARYLAAAGDLLCLFSLLVIMSSRRLVNRQNEEVFKKLNSH